MNIYTNNSIVNIVKTIVEKEKIGKDFTWHYLFILSHIRTSPFFDRSSYTNGYTCVNVELLRKLVSYDFAIKFLNDLVRYGVLKTDNLYMLNKKSKGYKISEEYMIDKFRFVKVEDEELNRKLEMKLLKDKNDLLKSSDGYGYVTKWMEKLNIDKVKAKRFIKDKIDKKDTGRIEFCKMVLDIFDNKFVKKDSTGDRLHNNLTNAPTEFRKYLRLDGKNLYQCDLKNSQPTFLYCYLKANCHIPIDELEKYRNVVCEYGFYEFFAEKLNITLTEDNRSSFKKKIFGGVLFDNNRKKLSKYEEVFKTEFPNIFYVVRSLKTKDYKDVAIILQKTESKFIFSCIEKLMFMSKNTIPLFTIHDSIATTEEYIETVRNIMLKEFEKDYTVVPKIKLEKFA